VLAGHQSALIFKVRDPVENSNTCAHTQSDNEHERFTACATRR
jgi:hypothetical protein